jgi:response regulator RpfG family c-di-GMP phosphodiesterase
MKGFDILMAHEDSHAFQSVSNAFKEGGFRVTKASTEDEAIELVRNHRFDAVITSVVLDPEKRNAVLTEAKKFNRDTVIVLLGSGDDPKHDHDTLSIGEKDYLFSPSGRPALWQRVQTCLQRIDTDNRDVHSRALILKLEEQVSRISESVSGSIRDELMKVGEQIQGIRDGAYGPVGEKAARQLDQVRKTVSWLAGESDMLSRGFLPRERPPGRGAGPAAAPQNTVSRARNLHDADHPG